MIDFGMFDPIGIELVEDAGARQRGRLPGALIFKLFDILPSPLLAFPPDVTNGRTAQSTSGSPRSTKLRAEFARREFIVGMEKNGQTNTGDMAPVVVADGQNTRALAMRWGFEPHEKRRGPRFLVRDDSAELEAYVRCLVPATALPLTDREGRKWIVTLEGDGSIFCFAGVCRPATDSWPDAYATVTVPAYPDLKSIKRRHIAILPQASWAEWLAGAPAKSILKPWPPRSFRVLPE